jgi:hypothetical protein
VKNLFVFGDSFSTNYTLDNQVELHDSWPNLLAKKLNRNLKNYASAGMCNGEIINRFMQRYHEIETDDVVIIETGFFSRVLNPFTNSTLYVNDILNNSDDKNFTPNSEQDYLFYKQYVWNLHTYIMHDVLKYKFILDYLTLKNVNFYVWSVDEDEQLRSYLFETFSKHYLMYPTDWEHIVNNPEHWAGNDKHFNAKAHFKVAEMFYNRIQQ